MREICLYLGIVYETHLECNENQTISNIREIGLRKAFLALSPLALFPFLNTRFLNYTFKNIATIFKPGSFLKLTFSLLLQRVHLQNHSCRCLLIEPATKISAVDTSRNGRCRVATSMSC